MDRNVAPDESLLEHIFATDRPACVSILLQNWDKCVFKAEFSGCRPPCVVRLEANGGRRPPQLATVAAMQHIAAVCIPDLVPKVLQVGIAANAQGRGFQFCVMQLAQGVPLDEVWDEMSGEDQRSIAAAVAEALGKLHSVRLSDDAVQAVLGRALGEGAGILDKAVIGGPWTGFLDNGRALLTSIAQRLQLKRPFYSMQLTADGKGLVIQSSFEYLGSATISDSNIEQWPQEAVFCHNDLTPGNILLQSVPDASPRYKLAAIIDWETAGFYPPSYELSLQDTYLSCGNQRLSFYLLLKQRMKDLVPRSPSQIALLHAMELLFESRQEMLAEGTNVPAHMRRRFRERLQLSRDEDPYIGWKPEQGAPGFSRADGQKLEDDVVAEMIARRQSKLN